MRKPPDKTAGRWREVLFHMRLPLCTLLALSVLAAFGIVLLRSTLLKNAYNTGTALSRNYAAEESNNLAVYQTLLTFGTASIDWRVEQGAGPEELREWMSSYFSQLNTVLGDGVVDPYMVLDGQILAANPWSGDGTYDVYSTEWYQKALAADGQVIFTNVYTDAIYQKPVITAAQRCQTSDTVMAFDILPEYFHFETVDLIPESSFFLCDSQGSIIYRQTALDVSEQEMQAYLNRVIRQIKNGELADATASIQDLDGHKRAVYHTQMENGWYSIVTVPYRHILGQLNWFILAAALLVALIFFALLALSHRELALQARFKRDRETVQVLGNSYYALYRVDFVRQTYEMIKGSEYVRSRIPPSGAYSELLRVAGEVIEADAFKDFVHSFSSSNIQTLVSQQVRDFGGEFLRRFGEEYRWVSVRVLFDESLASEEVVLSFREVEREKQRQLRERRLLEDALQLARQNEASKQAFFRNMSHDMRTPLNAIISLSELAQQNPQDPGRVTGYLQKISSSSRYLLGLINDILDMARMEQGKVVLEQNQFDLRACIEECLSTFHLQAETEGKHLETHLELKESHLLGDPFRLQQILNNLLSNSFKFTPAGGTISLSVLQMDQGEYIPYQFVVADTGIGMSPAFLEHLYEPYAREMRFSDKQASGTGLGMSITKSLVALMNGEIQVESEPGRGSVFTLVIPFLAVKAGANIPQQAADEQAVSFQGLRILAAEDNEVNMEILAEVLRSQGAQVTQAWNGRQAVERFQQSAPFSLDVILMDMQMPEMDGCEAARQIRALDRPDAKTVPIIAVTANAFAEDIAATTAAGMNAHISKPIDFKALWAVLGQFPALASREEEGPQTK